MDPSEKLWNTGGVWLSALDCLEGFKGGYENLGKAKYDTKGSEQIFWSAFSYLMCNTAFQNLFHLIMLCLDKQ